MVVRWRLLRSRTLGHIGVKRDVLDDNNKIGATWYFRVLSVFPFGPIQSCGNRQTNLTPFSFKANYFFEDSFGKTWRSKSEDRLLVNWRQNLDWSSSLSPWKFFFWKFCQEWQDRGHISSDLQLNIASVFISSNDISAFFHYKFISDAIMNQFR